MGYPSRLTRVLSPDVQGRLMLGGPDNYLGDPFTGGRLASHNLTVRLQGATSPSSIVIR